VKLAEAVAPVQSLVTVHVSTYVPAAGKVTKEVAEVAFATTTPALGETLHAPENPTPAALPEAVTLGLVEQMFIGLPLFTLAVGATGVTVTSAVQTSELPAGSVAVNVTVVVPIG
jgi:hypothetical protein